MTETRARYNVTIDRDASGLPTRLAYSPSTPVYPAVAVESNEPAAAAKLCPFCNGAAILQETYYDRPLYFVECTLCHGSSMNGDTPTEAWHAWNTRGGAVMFSRNDRLTAYVDDLLDLLQDVGGMSAEWCETKLQEYEMLLRNG